MRAGHFVGFVMLRLISLPGLFGEIYLAYLVPFSHFSGRQSKNPLQRSQKSRFFHRVDIFSNVFSQVPNLLEAFSKQVYL